MKRTMNVKPQTYIADRFRALKLREARAWAVLDAYMADREDKKIPAHVRLEAAVFILKRLYPETLKHEGSGENGEFKVTIEIANENQITSEPGNRISQYIEV